MSVRRVVLSSFVLVVLARATCAVAGDPSNKAVLGPAEPIGELLVLKAGLEFEDEPQPLPHDPIPLLPTKRISIPPGLLLAPADITFPDGYGMPGNGMLRATARITPSDEIALHLSQAILGLTAAGLNEEAEQVSSLLREFQTKHQARLLLAAKQAQLDALQAEIERLKLRVEKGITSDQIHLSVKFIEADGKVAEELLGELTKELLGDDKAAVFPEPARRLQSLTRVLDRKEFQRLVESKRKEGLLKVLAEPTIVAQTCRPARFRSGGSFPIPQIAQAGGPASIEYGTTVLATATILDQDLIRVALTAEFVELDPANSVNEIPVVNRRRVQTTLELKDGQTVIVGGLVASTETKTVATIITVTAEIIEPLNQIAVPLTPSVEVPQPTPTSLRLVK